MAGRLWIISDLHQELARFPWKPARPAFDVLVVAGDVFEGDIEASIDWVADLADGGPCVFVPGNHEFWRHAVDPVIDAGRARAAERGVTFLDGQGWVEVDGVHFAGCPLWTDQNLNLPFGIRAYPREYGEPILQREGGGDRVTGSMMLARHAVDLASLEEALGQDPLPAGPRVVVTHHAPHPLSVVPAWRHHPSGSLSASDLGHLLDGSACDLWIHGHVHHSVDYAAPLGTRVVCNPFGYHGTNDGFIEGLVVEVLGVGAGQASTRGAGA